MKSTSDIDKSIILLKDTNEHYSHHVAYFIPFPISDSLWLINGVANSPLHDVLYTYLFSFRSMWNMRFHSNSDTESATHNCELDVRVDGTVGRRNRAGVASILSTKRSLHVVITRERCLRLVSILVSQLLSWSLSTLSTDLKCSSYILVLWLMLWRSASWMAAASARHTHARRSRRSPPPHLMFGRSLQIECPSSDFKLD